MGRARVTINATMLASAIWIDARLESDVRTVVAGDDCFGGVAKILRLRVAAFFGRVRIDLNNVVIALDRREVSRIDWPGSRKRRDRGSLRGSAATSSTIGTNFFSTSIPHAISSHEHIRLSNDSTIESAS